MRIQLKLSLDIHDTHTLILTITIKDTFFPENEMVVNIKMCVGIYGGHGHDIFTCPSKTFILERLKHLK